MSFIKSRPQARYDFYAIIHKALRLMQMQLMVRLGACGGEDPAELELLVGDLTAYLAKAEHHLANEDRWVHTALEERAPGAASGLDQDHVQHRHTFKELEALIGRVERSDPATRSTALRELYLRFTVYVAEDLAHMAEEEQVILPVLQSLFSDEELIGIEQAILAGIEPPQKMAFARYMLPASTPAERLEWARAVRAATPPPAFEAMMTLAAQPSLGPAAYAELRRGLGLEPF